MTDECWLSAPSLLILVDSFHRSSQAGRRRVIVRHRTDHSKGARTKSCVERVVDLHESETLATVSMYVLHERPSDTTARHRFLVGGNGRKRHEPLGYAALVKLFKRHCDHSTLQVARICGIIQVGDTETVGKAE